MEWVLSLRFHYDQLSERFKSFLSQEAPGTFRACCSFMFVVNMTAEPITIKTIPKITFLSVVFPSTINAIIGDKTGLIKNTREDSVTLVVTIARK